MWFELCLRMFMQITTLHLPMFTESSQSSSTSFTMRTYTYVLCFLSWFWESGERKNAFKMESCVKANSTLNYQNFWPGTSLRRTEETPDCHRFGLKESFKSTVWICHHLQCTWFAMKRDNCDSRAVLWLESHVSCRARNCILVHRTQRCRLTLYLFCVGFLINTVN